MKILITADLDGREGWYRWLATQRPELLVVAGNLIADSGNNKQEIDFAIDQLSSLPFPVCVCGGTQDSAPLWFPRLAVAGIYIDGATAEIGEMLVTCLPHAASLVNDVILHNAQQRRKGRQWLVVHHVAPSVTPNTDTEESESAHILRQLRQYQPDFMACGHWRDPKYHKAWYSSVGRTKVFNPGFRAIPGDVPSCVILDSKARFAMWLDRGSLGDAPSRVEQASWK